MILISLGRILQLLFPNLPCLANIRGLRFSSNFNLILVIILLIGLIPESKGSVASIKQFLGIANSTARSNAQDTKQSLPSDAGLNFPTLPYVYEEPTLDDVKLIDLEGNTLTLGELKGKVVFLNAWATWCGPCRMEMPNLDALYESVKDEPNIHFALVCIEGEGKVKAFLKDNPHTAPIYTSLRSSLDKLKIEVLPTTIIIDKTGQIVFKHKGVAAWDGGTTREFLLALARDEAFAPPKQVIHVERPDGIKYEQKLITEDIGHVGLTYGSDGKVYYASYFNNKIGTLNPETGETKTLANNLNQPHDLFVDNDAIWFIEAGTEEHQYKDGTLSLLDLKTNTTEKVLESLQYPCSICLHGQDVYVLEAAGSSTPFGGNNRLIAYNKDTRKMREVLPRLKAPTSCVLNRKGDIFIGRFSNPSPGDNGSLICYENGSGTHEIILDGLPSVKGLAVDIDDNIYLAGMGDDAGDKIAIGFIPAGEKKFCALHLGHQANALALSPEGDILFSTDRGYDSVRILKKAF